MSHTQIQYLRDSLKEAELELKNMKAPQITSEDIEDVSDAYQDRLEYNSWISEQKHFIETLKKEIHDYELDYDRDNFDSNGRRKY